jgi:hypothetical protein
LGGGVIMDIAAIRPVDDEACLLQGPQVLGDGGLRDTAAAHQFGHGDFFGLHDPLELGSASVRITASTVVICVMPIH